MAYFADDYQTLVIRREGNGNQVWIKGLKATFSYFGWDRLYDPWESGRPGPDGQTRVAYYGRSCGSGRSGGQRIRICRGLRQQGHPKGLTNCFRIHSHISNRDLAELAHFAGPEVGWMEAKCGRRLLWDEWEQYYQGQTLPFHRGRPRRVA